MVNALLNAPSAPPLDITIDPVKVARIEHFLITDHYKQMVAGTKKFNRKLNEERVSRMPYVDGQTGVAMKAHDGSRSRRERMPGFRQGQLYTYPSKRWKKSSYQYLKYPNAPTNIDFGQEIHKVEAWTPATMTPGGVLRLPWQQTPGIGASPGLGEGRAARQPARTASSVSNVPAMGLYGGGFYEDGAEDLDKSGSDDDYEGGRSKRSKSKKSRRKAPGSGATPGRGPRRSIAPPPAYNVPAHIPVDQFDPPPQLVLAPKKGTPTGYCDFCLGGQVPQDKRDDGKVLNRKSNLAEELIACAVCGHSGHPSCLQFTANMLTSVSGYPWQCMECKTCTICSTSENDDQLLFCDDCDRGYHMYCIVPPMKEAPEGSWSCVICVEKFHKD